MVKIMELIKKELETRKVETASLPYTFIKRKEGKLLNKTEKFIGGKVCKLYQFFFFSHNIIRTKK